MEAPDRTAVVVEDDPEIRELLADLLGQIGFTVTAAQDGATALRAIRDSDPDLVTLDLNLPDLDGVEVCRRIREHSDAYVIMLTARPDEVDRLIGLETGADDYLTKPFSTRELRARIAALMRRPRRLGARDGVDDDAVTYLLGPLAVDPQTRVATLDGVELDLTRTEFDLLVTVIGGPRRVWQRDALLREVWGSDWVGDGHLVEVHMGNLRRKLGDSPRHGRFIRTVRGVGYRAGPG